jgi:chromosome partitioning protein
MSKTLCIVNNKGGVGKTHTVFHLAGAFSDVGLRVLVVDLDAQANLTRLFLKQLHRPTIYDVLVDQLPLGPAVQLTATQDLEIAPADSRMNHLGYALQNQPDQRIRLDTAIRERQQQERPYDVVLLDCPPNLDAHTTNALCAADGVLIPMEADQFSVDGLQQLLDLIRQMQQVNRRLVVEGILISLYNSRRAIEQTIATTLRVSAGVPVLDVHIKNSARYRESITARQPITHYKPGSDQATAFEKLAQHLIQNAPGGSKQPQEATIAYANPN